ncbi:MAG: hypothetical protein AAGF13_07490 [Pseudomonadota bacterium]
MDRGPLTQLGRACRRVAVGLVARAWPGETLTSVEARVAAMPLRHQAVIVGSVLALLFALLIVALQFGWTGMLVFFVLVMLLVG